MTPEHWLSVSNPSRVRDTLIVSAVCFVRESLVEILGRVPGVRVCGQAGTLNEALDRARSTRPVIVLLDAAFPGGIETATRIGAEAPGSNLIVLGISETEADVLYWAEAGIVGYVPDTASIDDLISLIDQINHGGQTSSSRIVGSLLRRVAASGRTASATTAMPPLTRRELEILRLVRAGLSNKDIARELHISVGTTKSHVHSLLGKLSLRSRTEVMTKMSGARWATTN